MRRGARRAYADFQSRWLQRFIFIHINKTGGSSIEKALGLTFDHRTALEKREAVGIEHWNRCFTFSFVRNPWDKVVSHYHYRLRTQQAGLQSTAISFNEWVRRAYADRDPRYCDQPLMFQPQMDWIADEQDRILVQVVGRFERMEADFERVCRQLNRNARLPHLKPSPHPPYQDCYDPHARDIVGEIFARDIAALNYRF